MIAIKPGNALEVNSFLVTAEGVHKQEVLNLMFLQFEIEMHVEVFNIQERGCVRSDVACESLHFRNVESRKLACFIALPSHVQQRCSFISHSCILRVPQERTRSVYCWVAIHARSEIEVSYCLSWPIDIDSLPSTLLLRALNF